MLTIRANPACRMMFVRHHLTDSGLSLLEVW